MGVSRPASDRLFDRITLALADFSGVLLALVVVLVNVEIVLRYLFGKSTLVSDEYSGYFFVWMSLLGFGYALQTGQFLHVEALIGRFRGAALESAELFGALAGAAVAMVTTYACALTFLASWKFGTRSIQPSATPLWLPQCVMPVAFGWLSAIYLRIAVVRASRLLRRRTVR